MKKKTPNLEINIDETALNNIANVILSKKSVKIGIIDSSAHNGGAADIAAKHEFGDPANTFYGHEAPIPPRSFFRLSANQKGEDFQGFVNSSSEGIFRHIMEGSWETVLELFGFKWVEYITEAFKTKGWGQWLPLSRITVLLRKNHSDMPLQDTGAMLRSITSVVVDD